MKPLRRLRQLTSLENKGTTMPAKQEDLQIIWNVLLEFFETPRIVESLARIKQVGVSGWEKWWQTEMVRKRSAEAIWTTAE